jgi:hypothetical protein
MKLEVEVGERLPSIAECRSEQLRITMLILKALQEGSSRLA